jgi:hypothetical protein
MALMRWVRATLIVTTGVVALSICASVHADDQILKMLKGNLVKDKDGKFMLDRYRVCQVFRPKDLGGGVSQPFRVKSHVEAPSQGVISRDNFVALAAEIGLSMRVGLVGDLVKGMTPGQALDALRCREIQAASGAVDFTVNVSMTKDGMVVQIVDVAAGRGSTQGHTWAEIFGQ